MKLSTSLVAIKKITSTVPRSSFGDDKLEEAANLILEAAGVINPIVIRRSSINSFEVVDGHFEYHAAARAREIEPHKGEMIGAIIIESENEETLTKQVQLFRQQKADSSEKTSLQSKDIEQFLINLESRFEKITNQILEQATTNAKLENEVKELKKQMADKTEPIEVFKTLSQVKIVSKLQNAGFNQKKASQIAEIVENERNKKQFQSLNDVVERVKIPRGKGMVKAISIEKMLEIVHRWSENN
ncbi:ParB N-terminal domain-containing protein [Nostoc sp.]|uniref:ParB N-terminal domain-containing protein n=1 Tax=Nostoc sp. TaxID=1180 RepID=UPI002FF8A309